MGWESVYKSFCRLGNLVNVILALFVGATIYILFRSRTLLVFSWLDFVGIGEAVNGLRTIVFPYRQNLPEWFVYSLPDGLWVYAITSFYIHLWANHNSVYRFFWILLGAVCAIGGEFGQLLDIVPGTFCLMDLIICTAAFFLAMAPFYKE